MGRLSTDKQDQQQINGKEFQPTVTKDVVATINNDPTRLEAPAGVSEKKVIRKCDYRIVPWLSLLYLLSFLDRTNIGNANLFGLSADLGIGPTQYASTLAIFFAFYGNQSIIFEVPSNMVMKAWRPSMWLPIIMIAWGAVMIGMGFVQNYAQLFGTRIALGATEAGLFPGVSYFLTLWYRRYEVNFRIAMFFSAATIAGAFGGLLARLINLMDDVAGYEGWRWIFILEGIVTVVIAAASFWMLQDYPHSPTTTFLTPEEKEYLQARLKLDSDGLSGEFKRKFIRQAFLDYKVWVFAFMYQGCLMPVYSFSLFSPTLTANLGYSAANAQLLSVPPYVLAALTTISAGFLSDKLQKRAGLTMLFSGIGALGFILLISNDVPGVNFLGLFLAAAGCYPLIPLVLTWAVNNQGGALKRGVGSAIVVSMGNAGGIISSFTYPKGDAPLYRTGHAINLSWCLMCFVLAGIMWWHLKSLNKKKDTELADRGRPWTAEDKEAHKEEGDDAPFFRYTL